MLVLLIAIKTAVIFPSFGGIRAEIIPPPGLIPILDDRIIGGQYTQIQNFPHQISMRYMGNHRCGGSIISPNIILTAAHCVDGILSLFLSVRAGITQRDQQTVEIPVGHVIMHGSYSRQNMNNDIAVLSLSRKLEYSASIQPIALSESYEEYYPGRTVIVSGWGATREGGQPSSSLQFVELTIVSQNDCSKAYINNGIQITSNMICAGSSPHGGKDACQGDSGGPLISYDSGNQRKLVGIVSWGYGCARPQFPGVYTKVSSFRNWIDECKRILKDSS